LTVYSVRPCAGNHHPLHQRRSTLDQPGQAEQQSFQNNKTGGGSLSLFFHLEPLRVRLMSAMKAVFKNYFLPKSRTKSSRQGKNEDADSSLLIL